MRRYIGIAARGLAMGAADIVPGVSGGTIAFITGIYEELLESLSSLNFGTLKSLFVIGLAATWKKVNGNFLVALFSGILISIFSLAKVIKYFLESHPHLLWSFFFGLVGASIIYVAKQVEKWNLQSILALVAGGILAYYLTTLHPGENLDSWWYIVICGSVAICAMILPGISGSFILLILGIYPAVLDALTDFNIPFILLFATGCIAGLLLFSKGLNWMFKNRKRITIATLTGFLIGSLNKLWPWKNVTHVYLKHEGEKDEQMINLIEYNQLPTAEFSFPAPGSNGLVTKWIVADPQIGMAIGIAVFGFALIFIIERFAWKP